VEWSRDKPREFEIVAARAQVAGCLGKLQEARGLYEQTVQMAEQRNLADVATNHLSAATWIEMAYGNAEAALEGARRVLARNPSYDPCLRVALTLSAFGCDAEAEAIVEKLVEDYPEHTIINSILAPIVRAGIALARQQPAEAIEHLEVVAPYEMGFAAVLVPVYLRANSYLMLGSALEAAKEFQRLVDHRGSEPYSPFYAVARLGLARAHARAKNLAMSAEAYKLFLSDWASADFDIPVLTEAKQESAQLESSRLIKVANHDK
jgi:tetratricopeptide (TPR) repeat protein